MSKRKIVYLSFFLGISLTNCSNLTNPLSQLFINSETRKLNARTISGVAQFPKVKDNLPKSGSNFSVKATQTTVTTKATVSLIYPPDYSNESMEGNGESLRNVTITGGFTDNLGKFTLNANPSFTPQENDIFILEATKRIGGSGNNSMSLRTFVQWNGTNYQSITTPDIYINTKTTAMTILSDLNSSTLPENTIGKIIVGTGNTITINESFDDLIILIDPLVTESLEKNLDPVAVIVLKNGNYFINTGGLNKVLFGGCVGSPTCMDLVPPAPSPQIELKLFDFVNKGYFFYFPVNNDDENGQPVPTGEIRAFANTIDPELVDQEIIATSQTVINLSDASNDAAITFTHEGNQVSETSNNRKLEYSIDDGTSWNELVDYNQDSFGSTTETVPLTGAIGHDNVHIRFRSIVSSQDIDLFNPYRYYWDIKDIFVFKN